MAKKRESVKIFFIERKWWTAIACLCVAALMFYVVNYPAAVGASASARQLPIYCVQRDQKLVSISFDAAWGDVILRQTGTVPFSIIYRRGSNSPASYWQKASAVKSYKRQTEICKATTFVQEMKAVGSSWSRESTAF